MLVWSGLKCQNLYGDSKSLLLYRLLTRTCCFIAVTILTFFSCKYFFCARVMSWLDSVTKIRFMVFAKGFFLKRYPPRPVSSLRFPYLYFIITLSCYFVNTFFNFYLFTFAFRFPFLYLDLIISLVSLFVNPFFYF